MHNNYLTINIILTFSCVIFTSCGDEVLLSALQAEKYLIAHRGSYQLHGLPENSRASLKEALSLHIYGTEFDVRQTKDNVLVISHDDIFNGMEISKSNYSELTSSVLSNGETIPTLQDFFSLFKEMKSSKILFVELKSCDINKLVDMVNKFAIQNNVRYISFSKGYCDSLVQLGLGDFVLYLGGDLSPTDAKNEKYCGISYQESVFISHPEWLDEAIELGLTVCVWPINDIKQMNYYINRGVLISTDIPYLYNN